MSVSDLCIRYVNSHDWLVSIVIDADSHENLLSYMQSISMLLMSKDAIIDLSASRSLMNSNCLNPEKLI